MAWHDAMPLEVRAEMAANAPNMWASIEYYSQSIRLRLLEKARRDWEEFVERSGLTKAQLQVIYRDRKRAVVAYQAVCKACSKVFDVDSYNARLGHDKCCSRRCAVEMARRSRRHYTIDGVSLTLSQWARKCGLRLQVVDARIKRGWTLNQALGLAVRKALTSQCRGVNWCKLRQKWRGEIYVNKKRHNLGYFGTEEEAIAAVTSARDKKES